MDAVANAGISAIGLCGYIPQFFYTKGCAAATGVKAVMCIVDTDGEYGKEGKLVPADAVDIAALGTIRVLVVGKAA